MKQKFTSTIAGASIFISLLGLFSRGLGFLREMLFANNFGLETEFDLYLVGAVLPIIINTVLLYIGQNFFVPAFQRIKSSDFEKVNAYYNQAFILFIGSGIFIALLLILLSEPIINLYMHSAAYQSRETAILIFRIFLLTIPLAAGVSMLSALLQSVFEFKYPSVSILFLNISVIIMIFLFTKGLGIYVIPAGYLLGTLIQFGYLLVRSGRYFKLSLSAYKHKYSLVKDFFVSSLVIIILIESIGQLYTLIDRYFYGQVSSGGIASLNYAYIIFSLPISILSISLATAVFPKITKAISERSNSEIERIYNESISINIFIFMPLTFLLFYFGDTLIKIAFERGKFLAEGTAITYGALRCYSVSLVFYSVYAVLNKIFYSLNLAKLLLVITIAGILLKLILNFLLVSHLQQYGLADSTSVSYIFFFTVSYMIIKNKIKIKDSTQFIKEFFIYLINCAFSYLIISILAITFSINGIFSEVALMVLFIGLYFLNSSIVKHRSVMLLNRVFRRLNSFGLSKAV